MPKNLQKNTRRQHQVRDLVRNELGRLFGDQVDHRVRVIDQLDQREEQFRQAVRIEIERYLNERRLAHRLNWSEPEFSLLKYALVVGFYGVLWWLDYYCSEPKEAEILPSCVISFNDSKFWKTLVYSLTKIS